MAQGAHMNARNTVIALLSAAVLFTAPAMLSADPAPDSTQKAAQADVQADPAKADAKAKHEQFVSIMKSHRSAMRQLEDKMEQKQMELDYIAVNPNTKPADIKALIAEIFDLRAKIRSARSDVRNKLKEAGLPMPREHRDPFRGKAPMRSADLDRGPHGMHFPQHHDRMAGPEYYGPQNAPMFDGPMPHRGFGPHHHPMMDGPRGFGSHHHPMAEDPCGCGYRNFQPMPAPSGQPGYFDPQGQSEAPEGQAY